MEVKGNLIIYVDLGCFDKEIVVIVIFSCVVKHTSNLFSIKTKSYLIMMRLSRVKHTFKIISILLKTEDNRNNEIRWFYFDCLKIFMKFHGQVFIIKILESIIILKRQLKFTFSEDEKIEYVSLDFPSV